LAHLLSLVLLVVMTEKGIAIEMPYSFTRSLITVFFGFILLQQGTCFIFYFSSILPMTQQRKSIKTFGNLIYTQEQRSP
jgi:hypothetical protein